MEKIIVIKRYCFNIYCFFFNYYEFIKVEDEIIVFFFRKKINKCIDSF